jgi:hypothetical protein
LKGETMTVSEIIINWTEEERKQHANLIMECLEREKLLNDLKGKIEASEKDLTKNLDQLLSGLSQLSQTVNKTSDQMENIYFHLVKAQGNA